MSLQILHVDFDAFFASVEKARNPLLRNRPVAVGNGVIASCCYDARRRGLYNAMPLSRARRICPDLVILDGSYPVYRAFADQIFDLCRAISPNVETFLDEAYVELTGTRRLHGSGKSVGRELRKTVRAQTGLPVTVGVGSSRMIAKLAGKSVKPDGLGAIPPGEEAVFIGPLPVRDLPGVGYRYGEILEKLQINTIAELRAVPAEALTRLFGSHGEILYRRCRGEDSAVIEEQEMPKSVSRETSFHVNTSDRREVEGMLSYLSERAVKTVRELGLETRTVHVRIRYAGGGGESKSKSLACPTSLHEPVLHMALWLLDRIWTRREALHLAGVSLTNIGPPRARQTDLYEEEGARREESLTGALDRVRDRFGFGAVVAGKSLDLIDRLERSDHGFVLRTPSLTR